MPDYSHLSAPIADTRYVLAAHYLRNCRRVVEVGGHRLHTFMGGDIFRQFWNIDPCDKERSSKVGVENFCMPALAFDFNYIGDTTATKAGLCLLGLEMYDDGYGLGSGVESTEKLCTNLDKFSVVVIEFVPENTVARLQALMLLGASQAVGLERTIAMKSEWVCDAKYQEPNGSFSKQRELWILS